MSAVPTGAVRTTESDVLSRLLSERHSCRMFAAEPVGRDHIEAMLFMAQKSASWANTQPWDVIVTSGSGTERFRAAMMRAARTEEENSDIPGPREYVGRFRERRRQCGWGLYNSVGITRGDSERRQAQYLENYRFFGAPHVLLVLSNAALGAYGLVDCGAYISNFLLAAQALGIAAVPQAAIAFQSRAVHEHFSIGEDRTVVAAVSFGYEANHPANDFRTTRAPLDEVIRWVDE